MTEKASMRLIEPLEKANEDLILRQTNLRRAEETYAKKAETARTELDAQLPRVAEFKAKIEMGRKRQKESEQTINPFRDQLRDIQRRYDKLKSEVKQTTKSWKEHTQRHEQFEFWSRGFRDIKLTIVEELLQELELCVNNLLPQVGLVGWRIEFAIERETKKGSIARGIDLTILPYQRSADRRVKFANWSGGEAQRLRLVGSTALADVLLRRAGVEASLQILDEPTRGLSPKGVIHMVEFLAERAASLGRIILLADQTVIESASFSGSLSVKRTKNGTQVPQ
jgi:DNA repair exonuclease SbcCD ATPase subunit